MSTRRQDQFDPSTAKVVIAGKEMTPMTEEDVTFDSGAPKKRTRSDGALAGALWQRLNDIDAEEAAELEASPETIKAKHEARRAKALSEVNETVKRLVMRMRGEEEGAPLSG